MSSNNLVVSNNLSVGNNLTASNANITNLTCANLNTNLTNITTNNLTASNITCTDTLSASNIIISQLNQPLSIQTNYGVPSTLPYGGAGLVNAGQPFQPTLLLKNTKTDGTAQKSIVFESETNLNSDYGAIVYIDNVSQLPVYNYFSAGTGNENSALILTSMNDSGSNNGGVNRDNIILNSAGNIVLDTGLYTTNAVPNSGTKTQSGSIVCNPYGGALLVNQINNRNSTYSVDINGNLNANNIFLNQTALSSMFIRSQRFVYQCGSFSGGSVSPPRINLSAQTTFSNSMCWISVINNQSGSNPSSWGIILPNETNAQNSNIAMYITNFSDMTISVSCSSNNFVGLSNQNTSLTMIKGQTVHLALNNNYWCVVVNNTNGAGGGQYIVIP